MAINENQIDSQIGALKGKLQSSPTAYSAGAYTSKDVAADNQLKSLENLKSTMLSNQAKKDWYSTTVPSDKVDPAKKIDAGFISNGLDALQRPLRAVVGAAKFATGNSGGKRILDSINKNVNEEKDDFSGLLRQMNLPAPVAAPLGFMMDLTMDPVNWLTLGGGSEVAALGKGAGRLGEMGTVGLKLDSAVPKLAYGLTKAGVEGGAAAVKSSFWDTASSIARFIPGTNKNSVFYKWSDEVARAGIKDAPEVKQITRDMLEAGNAGKPMEDVLAKATALHTDEKLLGAVNKATAETRLGSLAKKIDSMKTGLGEKATASKEAYEGLLGFGKDNPLIENIVTANANRMRWSDVIRNEISNLSGGNKALDLFNYDPKEWYRIAKIKDELWKGIHMPDEAKVIASLPEDMALSARTKRLDELSLAAREAMKTSDFHGKLMNLAKDGEDIVANKVSENLAENLADNATRLYAEGADHDDVMRAYREIIKGTAEGDWVEEMINAKRKSIKENWSVGKINVGEKLIKAYDDIYKTGMGIFKSTKVGGLLTSPGAHLNAWIGNHAMAHMSGIDITRGDYLKSILEARNFYKGNKTAEYAQRILGGEIEDYAKKYPGLFTGMFGFTPNKIKLMRDIDDEIELRVKMGKMSAEEASGLKHMTAQQLADNGEISKEAAAQMKDSASFKEGRQIGETLGAAEIAKGKVTPGNILSDVGNAEKKELAERSGFSSASYIGNELTDTGMNRIRESVKMRADNGDNWAKIANYVLNKGPQEYEMIDQSNRLGLFTHLVKNGLTEPELQRISRVIDLNPAEDLLKAVKDGKNVYKLNPQKANELVSIVYLNYAAMPAFVRAMRSAPIVGSPFFSFTYGMGAKAMQTLADNPAAYNKISNAMNATETFAGGRTPSEKKTLAESPFYSWYNKPGMISLRNLSFFGKDPVFLNATNFIPYMSLNIMNPSERKYDGTWPGKIAEAIDKTPFFKTPEGSLFFDYVIQPQLLGIKDPQNQFGSRVYPQGSSAIEKTGYAVRSLAEAFVPSSLSIAEAVTPTLPENLIPLLPSYSSRAMENAKLGKSPSGVMGKEAPGERTARRILSTMGVSLNRINTDSTK